MSKDEVFDQFSNLQLINGICAPALKLIATTARVETYRQGEYIQNSDCVDDFDLLIVVAGGMQVHLQERVSRSKFVIKRQSNS